MRTEKPGRKLSKATQSTSFKMIEPRTKMKQFLFERRIGYFVCN